MESYYLPRTPNAALKAVLDGLLPPEAYIYKAVSVEPLTDTPDNLEEIDWMLGQKDRDLETNLLLLEVLGKLIKNPDKEKALFAAESINAIEQGYTRRIESLAPEQHRERGILFMEMAELNSEVSDLKNFYLREAFTAFRNLEKKKEAAPEDILNMSRILVKLDLPAQAEKTIEDNGLRNPDALFILAETAYSRREFAKLRRIMEMLDENRSELDINQCALIDFWTGRE